MLEVDEDIAAVLADGQGNQYLVEEKTHAGRQYDGVCVGKILVAPDRGSVAHEQVVLIGLVQMQERVQNVPGVFSGSTYIAKAPKHNADFHSMRNLTLM